MASKMEIWVSEYASLHYSGTGIIKGSGTWTTPYYGDLSAIIDKAPAYSVVHLLPGQFHRVGTRHPGDHELKSGQRILGSGMFATKVTEACVDTGVQAHTFYASPETHGIEVADMTVDGRPPLPDDVKKVAGVILKGSHSAIRRVRSVGCYGRRGTQSESFSLYVGNPGKLGNIIEDCLVEEFGGDYVNGLSCGGGAAIIRNNTVLLPIVSCDRGVRSPDGHLAGINLMHVDGVLVSGNRILGGSLGIYNDTGDVKSVSIVNNILRGCWTGVLINNDHATVDDLAIVGNTFDLPESSSWIGGCPAVGITIWNQRMDGGRWDLIRVEDNLVRTANNRPGEIRFCQLVAKQPGGIATAVVEGNIIERAATFRAVNATGVNFRGNLDLEGEPKATGL